MKKGILLALLVICSTIARAQVGEITIEGKVDNIKKGRLYLLTRSSEEKTDTLGFCDIKRGKFKLKATANEPLVTQLVLEGYSGGFTLLAEPGEKYKAFLSNSKNYYIRGGALNDRYTAHITLSDSLRKNITLLQQRYDSLRANRKFRSASQANDTLKKAQKEWQELTSNFLASNDNLITAYTIYSNVMMRDMGLAQTKEMYNSMGKGAKATQCARIIKERIERMEKTSGGKKAPDFTLPDINGNPVAMSQVKGKIKIIDFWASWCGPCRMNNPALRKLYEEYHDKGLEVIGVSLDNKKANWQMAVEKDGLTWINLSSLKGWKCDVAKEYNVTSIPALFILDENNNIIATGLRGEQLKKFLQENLE